MAKRPVLVPFDYVLRTDRDLPAEEQTIWHLRPVTASEWEIIEHAQRLDNAEYHAHARMILDYGLLGWSNYDGDPGRVEAPRKKVGSRLCLEASILDQISPYIFELAQAITETRFLDAESRKNS